MQIQPQPSVFQASLQASLTKFQMKAANPTMAQQSVPASVLSINRGIVTGENAKVGTKLNAKA